MRHTITTKTNLSLFALILFFSPFAFASNSKIPWALYLVVITLVSIVGSWWVTGRKEYESGHIKFLAASVYFWVFTFMQTAIWAAIYAITR